MRDAAKPTLPDGDAQVVLIWRMMDDVKIPEKTDFVAKAMKPVISKIVNKDEQNPSPDGIHRHLIRRVSGEQFVEKNLYKTENKAERDADETD